MIISNKDEVFKISRKNVNVNGNVYFITEIVFIKCENWSWMWNIVEKCNIIN